MRDDTYRQQPGSGDIVGLAIFLFYIITILGLVKSWMDDPTYVNNLAILFSLLGSLIFTAYIVINSSIENIFAILIIFIILEAPQYYFISSLGEWGGLIYNLIFIHIFFAIILGFQGGSSSKGSVGRSSVKIDRGSDNKSRDKILEAFYQEYLKRIRGQGG